MKSPHHRYGVVDVSAEDRIYRVRMATTFEQLDEMLQQPADKNPLQKTVLKAIEVKRNQLLREADLKRRHERGCRMTPTAKFASTKFSLGVAETKTVNDIAALIVANDISRSSKEMEGFFVSFLEHDATNKQRMLWVELAAAISVQRNDFVKMLKKDMKNDA